MYALFWLGRMIEPALGHARFLAIYFASLLCGSLGVLLLQPNAHAVGASGAIFGLFGAAIVMAAQPQHRPDAVRAAAGAGAATS